MTQGHQQFSKYDRYKKAVHSYTMMMLQLFEIPQSFFAQESDQYLTWVIIGEMGLKGGGGGIIQLWHAIFTLSCFSYSSEIVETKEK